MRSTQTRTNRAHEGACPAHFTTHIAILSQLSDRENEATFSTMKKMRTRPHEQTPEPGKGRTTHTYTQFAMRNGDFVNAHWTRENENKVCERVCIATHCGVRRSGVEFDLPVSGGAGGLGCCNRRALGNLCCDDDEAAAVRAPRAATSSIRSIGDSSSERYLPRISCAVLRRSRGAGAGAEVDDIEVVWFKM